MAINNRLYDEGFASFRRKTFGRLNILADSKFGRLKVWPTQHFGRQDIWSTQNLVDSTFWSTRYLVDLKFGRPPAPEFGQQLIGLQVYFHT